MKSGDLGLTTIFNGIQDPPKEKSISIGLFRIVRDRGSATPIVVILTYDEDGRHHH